MLGLSPNATGPAGNSANAPPAPQVPQEGAAKTHGGTVIGMQSPLAGAGAPGAAPPQAPKSAGTQPEFGQKSDGLKRTMMGFGPPAAAPSFGGGTLPVATPGPSAPFQRAGAGANTLPNQPPSSPKTQPLGQVEAPPVANAPRGAGSPNFQRTMLGVALPGIAPLRPGVATAEGPGTPAGAPPPEADRAPNAVRAPEPPRVTTQVVETERVQAPPTAPSGSARVAVAAAPPAKGLPRGAIVLIIVAAVLAVVAGVVAFLWESPRPITAVVVADDHGTESLAVTCDDCTDGTVVALGTASVKLASHKGQLALPKPLAIGSNQLMLEVKRPGIGRDEAVTLSVVVGYRIRGDLSALAEDPPKAKVLVEAVPGTAVVVDGHSMALDSAGKAEYPIDVSKEIQGPSDTVVPFERQVPYVVTETGKPPHQGIVDIRFGIAPLRVDAPGASIVIQGETFTLSGHTLKDGRVSVASRAITVDTQGRFAQLMNVSSIGETTIVVRADAKDHAPRLVPVKVKRVASLEDEANAFRLSATSDYGSIADADQKKGTAVALDGEIVETRIDGEVTVFVLDTKTGCATTQCLTRVIYGARFDTKRGAKISVFGHVLGAVDGPRTGVKIPSVAAEFVLAAKKTR
jgi:hypothetical protein